MNNIQITEINHNNTQFQILRQDAQRNDHLHFSLFSLAKVFLATKETSAGILPLGFVVMTPNSYNPNLPGVKGVEVDAVYTDSAARRLGVGRKLLTEALESIKGQTLFAACRSTSIRLFESLGFKPAKVMSVSGLVYMVKEN